MKKLFFLTVMLAGVLALGFSQTQWAVNNAASWEAAINGITSGGNNQTHTITVSGTVSVPGLSEFMFGGLTGINVTLQGRGTLSLSSNGPLLGFGSGAVVVVRDLTLQGRAGNNLAVVFIATGGEFRMEGNASIRGNGTMGVFVGEGGEFRMGGSATISDNGASGVFIGEGGEFHMEGRAAIRSNSIGGVFVDGGTFIMQSGTISGNSLPGADINEGIIYGGAGVAVRSGGIFTMQGGAISDNSNESGGGGGGGVSVHSGGNFIMEGGTISGNSVMWGYDGMQAQGGGVSVGFGGAFTMRGGTISGNTAGIAGRNWGHGGGVYINERGTFVKTGGIIHGNNERNASLRNTVEGGDTRGHAVAFGDYFRDATLAANAGGNISTTAQLPSASGQTLNNWTRR